MRLVFSLFIVLAATLSVLPGEGGRGSGTVILAIRSSVLSVVEWFGQFGIFCKRVLKATFSAPFEGREFLRQLNERGSNILVAHGPKIRSDGDKNRVRGSGPATIRLWIIRLDQGAAV